MAKREKTLRIVTLQEFFSEELALTRTIARISADKGQEPQIDGVKLKTTSGEYVYVVPDKETRDRIAMSDMGVLSMGKGE